jgi:hypothetical protein
MSEKKIKIDQYNALTFEFPDLDGEAKLRELILYIADRCFDDRYFGAIKLNKILYYADFEAFRRHGKPITGVKYQRLDEGPAPKRLVPIRNEMIEKEELFVKPIETIKGTRHKLIALRKPDLDIFTANEIAIVDQVIHTLWNKTAKQVSKSTHGITWHVYKNHDLIPYESVHIDDRVTDADITRAHELIEKYGWDNV